MPRDTIGWRETPARTRIAASTTHNPNDIPSTTDRATSGPRRPDRPDSSGPAGSIASSSVRNPPDPPRAERRAPHRLRQRHDGDPLRPPDGAPQPPRLRHHQGQGRRAARLRRLAPLPAVHRAARRVVDRHDHGAGLRVVEEERDRHPPRDRRDRARVHAARDRHLHPALRRLRLLEPRHQAQGVRQVRHRRRHSRVVERPARA